MVKDDLLKRVREIWLLLLKPPLKTFAAPPLQFGPATALKSPLSMAWVGTKLKLPVGSERTAVPWYPAKKKSLSFLIAPPTVPPYWLRFSVSRVGSLNLRALKR